MLQVLIRKGRALAEIVPRPQASPGRVLIKVAYSCISAGTELAALDDSGRGVLRKAVARPARLGRLLSSLRQEGWVRTFRKVRRQMAPPATAVGYSAAGVVAAAGEGVTGFARGDRAAAAGGGFAVHAEYVEVPVNLVVPVPGALGLDDAATVALGAIALHGVRRADLRVGEIAVVVGAGVIGLLSLQLLRASGVRVAAVEVDPRRLRLAARLGAELCVDPIAAGAVTAVETWSGGPGADAVLFTAATAHSDAISQSFRMCRKKGRVVLVGASGLALRREDLYARELDLLMSTSYGPGRYDDSYETQGRDYPYAYVRWTENRNMAEFLRLVAAGVVDVGPLKEGVFPVAEAAKAYACLQTPPRPLIVLLSHGSGELGDETHLAVEPPVTVNSNLAPIASSRVRVGLIGAGSYASGTIVPLLASLGDRYLVRAVAGRAGHRAKELAERCGAGYVTTDSAAILDDADVDLVAIATRHDLHASLALAALRAGKHVLVEKPLAISREQLAEITAFYAAPGGAKPLLLVGFNRRFSRLARAARRCLENRQGPLFAVYRMNAGYLPAEHWVHGVEGGGRIVGEGCHAIDLFTFLTGATVEAIAWDSLAATKGKFRGADNKALTLRYRDGSVCVLAYFALGSRELPKERVEIHFDEKSIVIDDYRRLTTYGFKGPKLTSAQPEKGHRELWLELYEALRRPEPGWPIELWDMVQTTEITLAVK